MMRFIFIGAIGLMLSACQSSPLWFDPDYWFGAETSQKETKIEQWPDYIPLAAVPSLPDLPDLPKWISKNREDLKREIEREINLP